MLFNCLTQGAENLRLFRPYFELYHGTQEEIPQPAQRRGRSDEKGFTGGIRILSCKDIPKQEKIQEGENLRYLEKRFGDLIFFAIL
nr:MAG TPA: hypothetical protein [Bacteriophage sp.]